MKEFVFQDIAKARNSITLQQRREIQRLYSHWADEIGDEAERYARKVNATAPISSQQMRNLQAMLVDASDRIADNVESLVTNNMRVMSETVVRSNTAWLVGLGFPIGAVSASMNVVPDTIVHRIVTGQIYDTGWSLSKAIWGDKIATQKQVYEIVAGGRAMNETAYEITKKLEQYVRPEAAKQWNLKMANGRKIYPRNVDYSAQRLARTLTQHSYQQTFIGNAQKNPYVIGIRWIANGSRACPICLERDGKIYDKFDVPMDHPNGMCVFAIVLSDDWLFNLRSKLF